MSKSAILLAANYSNTTGYAWNNIYRLYNVIARHMHQQGLSVCLSFAQLEPPVQIIDDDIPFDAFQFDPRNVTFKSLLALAKLIKTHKVKYAYFTDLHIFRGLYIILRILGVKRIVVHSRISVSNPYPADKEKGLRRIIKIIFGRIAWVAPDRVYAVSDFVKNRIVNKNCFPESKVITILNGIDINYYKCHSMPKLTDKVRVFAGSRATRNKGVGELIKAANELVDNRGVHNFILEYAGEGPDLEEFKNMVEQFNLQEHFVFLGQLPSAKDALCKADIAVVPSIWGDACPSAVSEALAAGKALITTSAGGIPEIVGKGENAIIVPPADHIALADALERLITNRCEREKLGSNARARAGAALDERGYYRSVLEQLTIDLGMSISPTLS